jgi:hypothetical protein
MEIISGSYLKNKHMRVSGFRKLSIIHSTVAYLLGNLREVQRSNITGGSITESQANDFFFLFRREPIFRMHVNKKTELAV